MLDRSGDLPGVDLRSAGLKADIDAPVTETMPLDAALRDDVTLIAAYEGQFGQGYRDHRGQAGLQLQW